MRAIPREMVAEALGVSPEALPDGDLPAERMAARLLGFLSESLADEAAPGGSAPHPEAWTFLLFGELVSKSPELALDVVLAMVPMIDSIDEAEIIASGPLDELLNAKGPELMSRLQAAVAESARFAAILRAVEPEGSAGTMFCKAVKSLTANAASLQDGDDLPEV